MAGLEDVGVNPYDVLGGCIRNDGKDWHCDKLFSKQRGLLCSPHRENRLSYNAGRRGKHAKGNNAEPATSLEPLSKVVIVKVVDQPSLDFLHGAKIQAEEELKSVEELLMEAHRKVEMKKRKLTDIKEMEMCAHDRALESDAQDDK